MGIRAKFRTTNIKSGHDNSQAPLFVKYQKRKGFTLIEVIIAIAVFTIGITAAFNLALSNYLTDQENFDRVVGSNLAREGIELVRNVRDSNWLRADQNVDCSGSPCVWSSDLASHNYIYLDYNDIEPVNIDSCLCVNDLDTCIDTCDAELYVDTDGYYNHDDQTSDTRFRRLIKLQSICIDSGGTESIESDNSCDAGDTLIGFKVTSRVSWPEGTSRNYIDVAEYLYNWR